MQGSDGIGLGFDTVSQPPAPALVLVVLPFVLLVVSTPSLGINILLRVEYIPYRI